MDLYLVIIARDLLLLLKISLHLRNDKRFQRKTHPKVFFLNFFGYLRGLRVADLSEGI